MEKQNTNERANLLLEAAACRQVCKDLGRLVEKYQRAVEREAAARQEALAAALEYRSEREIQDAYGYDMLTERQYEQYLDLFRRGQEAMENPPSMTKLPESPPWRSEYVPLSCFWAMISLIRSFSRSLV